MNDQDLITASLEQFADDGDVSAALHRRFAAARPDLGALMSHMDDYMLGRMMGDVLTLLITDPAELDLGYLDFEVTSHRAYGVTPEMFPPLLQVVRDSVRDAIGRHWDGATAGAWERRVESIQSAIDGVAAAH